MYVGSVCIINTKSLVALVYPQLCLTLSLPLLSPPSSPLLLTHSLSPPPLFFILSSLHTYHIQLPPLLSLSLLFSLIIFLTCPLFFFSFLFFFFNFLFIFYFLINLLSNAIHVLSRTSYTTTRTN